VVNIERLYGYAALGDSIVRMQHCEVNRTVQKLVRGILKRASSISYYKSSRLGRFKSMRKPALRLRRWHETCTSSVARSISAM
jgi:hypothetical protein